MKLMRAIFFMAALLSGVHLQSQTPYVPPVAIPYNPAAENFIGIFTSGNYTNYKNGTQNVYAYNASLNAVGVTYNANYTIKAANSIDLKAGTSVTGLSAGSFHGYTDPPPFQVVSFHPNGFNGIPLYDKFELGLTLPENITKRIDDFFGEYKKGGKNGYGCHYDYGPGSVNINPYDPDQISVEATFTLNGNPSTAKLVYGFYYREYTYSSGANTPTYQGTDWIEDTQLKYHWRVRFAPKEFGVYHIKWVVKVKDPNNPNNLIILTDNDGQYFTTAPSGDRGFIQLNTGDKFFTTQTSGSPVKTILPIGMNIDAPTWVVPASGGFANTNYFEVLPDAECAGPIDLWSCTPDNGYYPSRFWRHREKIKRLAQYGANYVRVFTNHYQIENEHAGIYDAFQGRPLEVGLSNNDVSAPPLRPGAQYYKGINRQAQLWELDRLLDMAKENDIYVQLVTLAVTERLNSDTAPYKTTKVFGGYWKEHCYIPIITSPDTSKTEQFFTDPNSIRMYKKRLRYMIARYGYSTNIAAYELTNEADFIRIQGHHVGDINDVYGPWLNTMSTYIRTPVASGGLGHTDQLLTISTASTASIDVINTNNAGYLDFLSAHPYAPLNNTYHNQYGVELGKRLYYNKPCQSGETGLTGDACMREYSEYANPHFHKLLWSSTFTGGLTSGLEMWLHGLEYDAITWDNEASNYVCGQGFKEHFKPLQAFIKDIDFQQEHFTPKYWATDMVDIYSPEGDPVLEAFYLVNSGGYNADKAIGYVHNRHFSFTRLMNENNPAPFYDPKIKTEYILDTGCRGYGHPSVWQQPGNIVETGNLAPDGVLIRGMIPNAYYHVEWYDTYTDPLISTPLLSVSSSFLTDVTGNAVIFPPDFTYDCHGQEFAFKLYLDFDPHGGEPPLGGAGRILSPGSNISGVAAEKISEPTVFPNPATETVCINYDRNTFRDFILEIYDESSRLINKQSNTDCMDVSQLKSGLYFLKFTSGAYQKMFKVNVLH
jgi:hypothetical protein